MKKQIYKNLKTMLNKASFDISKFEGKKEIDVKVIDKIKINQIKDDLIDFETIRDVKFNGETLISIDYNCNLFINELVNKETFINDLKEGISQLTEAYSYISLMISNITCLSPFDAFVTPPVYDRKNLIIE